MIEKVVLNGEEHKLSPDYKDIRNKPSINGVELKDGDNKIEIVNINIDPDVDIVGEGETPSVINTGTPKSPTLKFSLPKGETGNTGNAYVPSVDENGQLSFTSTPDSELPSETPVYDIKGDRGVGLTATRTKNGKVTTVNITTEENEPVTELIIEDGKDAINPFKGLFQLNGSVPNVPTNITNNAVDGDYVYAPDTTDGSTTVIWKWNATNNEWDETNIDVSDVVGVEFPDGKPVSQTHIINNTTIGGSQDLLSADVGMELGQKLGNVDFKETKVNLIQDSNWFDGYYIKPDNGKITEANSGSITNGVLCVEVTGKKSVRFLGFRKSGTGSGGSCYGFASTQLTTTNISDFTLNKYTVYPNGATSDMAEDFIIPVPEGEHVYFLCTIRKYNNVAMTINDFYCYLQEGNTISEQLSNVDTNLKAVETQISENFIWEEKDGYPQNVFETTLAFTNLGQNSGDDNNIVAKKYPSTKKSIYFGITPERKGGKVIIKAGSSNAWFTFVKTKDISSGFEDGETKTLKELIDEDIISSYHSSRAVGIVTSNTEQTIDIPYDATFICIRRLKDESIDRSTEYYDRVPIYVKFKIKCETLKNNIDTIASNIQSSKTNLTLQKGYFASNGIYFDSNNIVTTSLIALKGYYIELHDAYKFQRVSMFNDRGELITYNAAAWSSTVGDFWGLASIFPQFYVRISIVRKDNGEIDINDNIIKKFVYLDDNHLIKENPTNIGIDYNIFRKKVNLLTMPIWDALNNINMLNLSSYYFLEGSKNRGIAYSEAAEYSKYVGHNISIRTYLTSLMNKRSVMYTEVIGNDRSTSSYGLEHHSYNKLAGSYYGTVCTGLTSWLVNLPSIIVAKGWKDLSASYGFEVIFSGRNYPNNSTTELDKSHKAYYRKENGNMVQFDSVDEALNWLVDNIKTGDVIAKNGHCSIVGDIYKDVESKRKFIGWLEQVKPRAKYIPCPIDKFKRRIETLNSNWAGGTEEDYLTYPDVTIVRRTITNETTNVRTHIYDNNTNFIQESFEEYTPELLSIDPDITTFEGEYASFTTLPDTDTRNNNKAILNIHRGGANGYTHLQIFPEDDDTQVAKYSLSNDNAWIGESVKRGNALIYPDDANDKEDWIIFDLKKITTLLSAGKYKARVIKEVTENNVLTIKKASGFTHWEMINLDLSYVVNGSNVTFNYSATGGTPYMLRIEAESGLGHNNGKTFALLDAESGSITKSWTSQLYDNAYNTKYVKLFVQGEYNDVVHRILYNEQGQNDPEDHDED